MNIPSALITSLSPSDTQSELDEIRRKFSQLSNDFEQLTSSKTQLEQNELTSKRKMDESNRSRQAVLDRTRDEYEKLLRKYTDLDELYQELLEKRSEETSNSSLPSSSLFLTLRSGVSDHPWRTGATAQREHRAEQTARDASHHPRCSDEESARALRPTIARR